PGTVRAPLDAYGSTSETAEGHILQRGLGVIPAVPRVGFLRCRRPRVGHSGDGRPDTWYLDQGRSNPHSFVSRNTLVSKRLSNLPGRQQLAGRTPLIMTLIEAYFSGPGCVGPGRVTGRRKRGGRRRTDPPLPTYRPAPVPWYDVTS